MNAILDSAAASKLDHVQIKKLRNHRVPCAFWFSIVRYAAVVYKIQSNPTNIAPETTTEKAVAAEAASFLERESINASLETGSAISSIPVYKFII